MCRAGAAPVGQDTGLAEIRELVEEWSETGRPGAATPTPGTVTERDTLADYAAHLRALVDLTAIRPLKVVVDAGNGMGGHTVPTVFDGLPARPRPDVLRARRHLPQPRGQPPRPEEHRRPPGAGPREGADLGLAFDGDADRCFVVDERGEPVSPSAITALVAARELAKHPRQGTVIHNLITSWSVPEVVKEHGGTPGPHPRRPLLHQGRRWPAPARSSAASTPRTTTSATSGTPTPACSPPSTSSPPSAARTARCPASSPQYDRYAGSGEINSTVDDQAGRTAAVRAAYADRDGVTLDELDGLTVTADGLVVQPPPLQHRAAAAPERGGPRRRDAWPTIRDEVLAIVRA